MEVIKTVTDGDCFFDSLLQSQVISIPKEVKTVSAKRAYLRKWLVDYMIQHVDPNVMPHESIEELYQAGKYACDAGDLVPLYAPLAFGIRLHVYDLHREPSQHYVIMRYHYGMEGPIVRMLRSGEHFRLLRPMANLTASMEALSLENDVPKVATKAKSEGANQYFASLVKAKANVSALKAGDTSTKGANKYFASLVEAKALSDSVKRAKQMDNNAALAYELAKKNEYELMQKRAQEHANAAYAASLMNGGTRRAWQRVSRRRLRTRKTRRM
jgi:hypothetical protein